MALKDLVAEKSVLTEAAIEEMVKDYVRYDSNERAIAFTPAFAGLSNKNKVLIYLVALQGWPYVLEDALPTAAKPSAIEEQLGIPGGTLRPILKDLKDRHVLSYKDGSYAVHASAFDVVRTELSGSSSLLPKVRRRRSPSRSNAVHGERMSDEGANAGADVKSEKRGGGARSKEIALRFRQWVDEGFFDGGRALAEVQARFHEEAMIIPQTSIPKYLLAAVRDKRLTRSKEDVNGKERWIYRTKA